MINNIIKMPSGVFKPYAGVSTAVIIFARGGKTNKVWFYDMEADGFSLDDKRDRIEANDIPDIVKEWGTRNKNTNDAHKAKHFFLPVNEIIDNNYDLSINRYKEIDYTPPKHDKPVVILGTIEKLEKVISLDLEKLGKL